ncbi:AAA family ATPase [Dactylosporangium aurantiacum]|uniref:AAA family ATPase n=1 Tax=Dactylosporangium aurantiacum TaxID=35754 RepID=A0A9Q9IGR2_9ACTN|nr:AAA domain-containing protein [Dactylosporangium aurantiacum]MDG6108837.1 AAA domain-containing protein [Dactylosporangium aurantiacum]UWZ55757.1 AAA family ATPase [Dactylosporangium aurantiacum]
MTANFDAVAAADRTHVLDLMNQLGPESAIRVKAPPGAGKSTLVCDIGRTLAAAGDVVPVITQTNAQANDLIRRLHRDNPGLPVGRFHGAGKLTADIAALAAASPNVTASTDLTNLRAAGARIIVAPAAKWATLARGTVTFDWLIVDEAYQMRADMLQHTGHLALRHLFVGDPGQLAPFSVLDTDRWQALPYSPIRPAMDILATNHPHLPTHSLGTSWRLPPSAASLIAGAFYPDMPFQAGTDPTDRDLHLANRRFTDRHPNGVGFDVNAALDRAAATGWAYAELPQRVTVRSDHEVAAALAALIAAVLARRGTIVSELPAERGGRPLEPTDIAVITAHNDQRAAVLVALEDAGLPTGGFTVSTANRIQGQEFALSLIWHPLAGRADSTPFHLDPGRMCVMLSRHRHSAIVVGRAGVEDLMYDYVDTEPVIVGEPNRRVDGWQANLQVLHHLQRHRIAT